MIIDGLKLMVIGMGAVFLFLTIMVFMISMTAKLVKPYAHLLEPPAAAPKKKAPAGVDNRSLVAAAIAAVHFHQNKK